MRSDSNPKSQRSYLPRSMALADIRERDRRWKAGNGAGRGNASQAARDREHLLEIVAFYGEVANGK